MICTEAHVGGLHSGPVSDMFDFTMEMGRNGDNLELLLGSLIVDWVWEVEDRRESEEWSLHKAVAQRSAPNAMDPC